MEQLNKIQRVRLTSNTVDKLDRLKSFGISKSKFIRQSIDEKIIRDMPVLLADEKRKHNLIKLPF